VSSLTEHDIRLALDALLRDGPEALLPFLDPSVVWMALDQPGYDCQGRDAAERTGRAHGGCAGRDGSSVALVMLGGGGVTDRMRE